MTDEAISPEVPPAEPPPSVQVDPEAPPAPIPESILDPVPGIQTTAVPESSPPVSAPTSSPTPQNGPWVVQMTYQMLRDLAARGRAGVQRRKRKKFAKIMEYLAEHGKVSTHEVAHILYVSHDTASDYLAQLTKEGQLKRIGHTGHAVYYVKV